MTDMIMPGWVGASGPSPYRMMSGAVIASMGTITPTPPPPTPTPPPPTPTPPPPTPTPTPPGGTITVETFIVGPIKGAYSNAVGYSNGETWPAGSAISPATLGGAAIDAFVWSNTAGSGDFSGLGTLVLTLDGDTGTGTHSAVINGIDIGASGAGDFSEGGTTYTWSSIADPFGSIAGATLPCTLT